MTKKRIIIVLGMHRSGTSAIARGLKALSVELGDNLMPAVPNNNDRGFWEDMDVYKFNEKLFSKIGTAWDRLSAVETARLTSSAFAQDRYDAAALLERKLAISPIFGFKDPRFSLLLPFWKCVFEDLGVDDRYIVAVRNPLEVAASLTKRDKFETTHGLVLWLKYTWAALQNSNDRPRVGVSYSSLVEDPTAQLSRIGSALDLPLPGAASPELVEYVSEFVADDLRHNRISDRELARHENLPAAIKNLYGSLRAWSLEDSEVQIPSKLRSEVHAFLTTTAPLLELADQLKAKATTAEKARVEMAKAVETIQAELKQRSSDVDVLRQTEAGLTSSNRELEQSLNAARGNLATQNEELEKLKSSEAKLRSSLLDLGEQLKSRSAALNDKQQQLSVLRTELEAKTLECAGAIEQRDLATARIHCLEAECATLKKACAELEANARDTELRIRDLMSQLEAKEVENASLHRNQSSLNVSLVKHQEEIADLRKRSDAKVKQFEEMARSRSDALNTIKNELDRARSRSTLLESQLQTASQSASENMKHLRLSRQALHEMRSSTSWKVTRPLRACREALTSGWRNFKQK